MTVPKSKLAELLQHRDKTLSDTKACLHDVKVRFERIDDDMETLTTNHPALAVGGAAILGLGTGAFINGPPLRRLAEKTAMLILTPLIGDVVQRITRLFSGEPDTAHPQDCKSTAE